MQLGTLVVKRLRCLLTHRDSTIVGEPHAITDNHRRAYSRLCLTCGTRRAV